MVDGGLGERKSGRRPTSGRLSSPVGETLGVSGDARRNARERRTYRYNTPFRTRRLICTRVRLERAPGVG